MSPKTVGTLLEKKSFEVIEAQDGRAGFGWEVDSETQRELDEIEDNVRTAEQKSGTLIVGQRF